MKTITIIQPKQENNRISLGISHIEETLKKLSYEISYVEEEPGNDYRELPGVKIYVGVREESDYISWLEEQSLLI